MVKGAGSCPADSRTDFAATKEGAAIYVEPRNGSAIYMPNSSADGCTSRVRSDVRIRIDGFGPGIDFCVRRRDDRLSHVYVTSEVTADSAEVWLWFTTTKRLRK